MPRLNDRRIQARTISTCLNLPEETRRNLELAIDGQSIKTLTQAVVEATKLLHNKRTHKRKSSSIENEFIGDNEKVESHD